MYTTIAWFSVGAVLVFGNVSMFGNGFLAYLPSSICMGECLQMIGNYVLWSLDTKDSFHKRTAIIPFMLKINIAKYEHCQIPVLLLTAKQNEKKVKIKLDNVH